MKDTIVQQQLKISKLERQASSSLSGPPPFRTTAEKREKDEQEAKDSSCGEVKRKNRKRPSSVAYPEFGSTLGKNSGSPKFMSSALQEQENNLCGGIKAYEPPTRLRITRSPVLNGTSNTRKIPSLGSPRGSITESMTSPSIVTASPTMSARVLASPASARFPDRDPESRPPSPESPYFPPMPEVMPRAFSKSTLESPKDVVDGFSMTRKPWSDASLPPTLSQVPTPVPAPTKMEPEKPLSLWERKKLKAVAAPAPGSCGWGSGTIAMPNLPGTSKNITLDTMTKLSDSRPNTSGPENIPESAVEIKHVPSPGGFGVFEDSSRDPLPIEEKEPAKEETATPAEEDEFDWAPRGKKNKKNKGGNGPQQRLGGSGTVQQGRPALSWF